MQKIMRRPEVEAATGLSRSTIYQKIAAGEFPKPVPLSDRTGRGASAVGWLESEIRRWQESRVAARDGAEAA